MEEQFGIIVTTAFSFGIGKCHGDTNHEHERRLNHVPKTITGPLDMAELLLDDVPANFGGVFSLPDNRCCISIL